MEEAGASQPRRADAEHLGLTHCGREGGRLPQALREAVRQLLLTSVATIPHTAAIVSTAFPKRNETRAQDAHTHTKTAAPSVAAPG